MSRGIAVSCPSCPYNVELTDEGILVPRGRRKMAVSYADIVRIEDHGDWLTAVTERGRFQIVARHLQDYPALREALSAKTSIALPPYVRRRSSKWESFCPLDWHYEEFPPPLVQWEEPEAWVRYREHLAKSKPRLGRELRFFVRGFTVILCVWISAWLLQSCLYHFPQQDRAFLLIFATIGSFLSAIVLTLVHGIRVTHPVNSGVKICFRDRDFSRDGCKIPRWDCSYRRLCGWAVIEREFQGRALHILLLKLRPEPRASDIALALPDAAVRDRVIQILGDKQIPQITDLKPSWEAE
jgi:hypothetical protein